MDLILRQQLTWIPYPKGSYAGRTVIITGSNTGLGKEAARHYARLGVSRLILAVRDRAKGIAAKTDIEATTSCGQDVIEVWQLDMGSYASVKSFATKASQDLERIDIFLANAGLARASYRSVEDNEETITVNVVSTFLLCALILPKMKETATRFQTRPTLSITSSGAHQMASFPQRNAPEGKIFDTINDPNAPKEVFSQQYPLSKMLEIFAVRAITAQSPAETSPITINCLCPGFCQSELSRDRPTWSFWIMKKLLARTTEQGSRTLLHAGDAGMETHGKFLSDCQIKEPCQLIVSEEGSEVQQRIWKELKAKLEMIEPGCTKNFLD